MSFKFKDKKILNLNSAQLFLLIIGFVLLVSPYIAFVCQFGSDISEDQEDWVNLASFFGSFTSPFIAYVSLFFLLVNLNRQTEIHRANVITSFEASFFGLLGIFHQSESNTYYSKRSESNKDLSEKIEGKKVFHTLFNEFNENHLAKVSTGEDTNTTLTDMKKEYEKFYQDHINELGNYFRALYNVIAFVHSHKEVNKRGYMNIVMSYLDNSQLWFLLFNIHSKYGEEKFLPLVKRYSLLENLNTKENITLKKIKNAHDSELGKLNLEGGVS